MLLDEHIELMKSEADQEREEQWYEGFHVTREGEEIPLHNMTDSHLRNTIRFFSYLDTYPLERELNTR